MDDINYQFYTINITENKKRKKKLEFIIRLLYKPINDCIHLNKSSHFNDICFRIVLLKGQYFGIICKTIISFNIILYHFIYERFVRNGLIEFSLQHQEYKTIMLYFIIN